MLVTKLLFGVFLGLAGASVLPDPNLLSLEKRQDASSSDAAVASSTISEVASSTTSEVVSSTSSLAADCTNAPNTRGCWDSSGATNFSIATDAETSWPSTGTIVPYTLVVSAQTLAPDGTSRAMLVINGTYPGPTLTANWGDTLQITVINKMTNNGTSIHWHGVSQVNSCTQDGVNGVTECPIPPNASRTYIFQATEHGTSWYHSHYSAQYGDGVVGSIVINGPASANYDVDLGAFPITDFYYKSMYLESVAAGTTGPPQASNGLINGTMKNVAKTTGTYNTGSLTAGKRYRLRLINTSVDNHFYVSLDSHPLLVIQSDFVSINPYNATWLFLAIGQRYDVIITASQTPSNYWFRAETKTCGNNANEGNIYAIFNYNSISVANPTSTISTGPTFSCTDETSLVPYVVKAVPSDAFTFSKSDTLPVGGPTKVAGVFQWNINGTAIDVDWDQPTLEYIAEGNTSYPASLAVLQLPAANVWSFWVIQNGGGVPHPIHIHGHDFSVLGAVASSTFSASSVSSLNFVNPPRRDVAMLPASGWLVIGFETNNPGAWLMHCHIAWHVGEGLAVQFLERASEIATTMDLSGIQSNCDTWDSWYATAPYKKLDSGL